MTLPFALTFDRALYSRAYLTACLSEAAAQKEVLAALQAKGIVCYANDVGAKAIRGRAAAVAKKNGASAQDMRWLNTGKTGAGAKGLVDIVGVIPNHVHKLGMPWGIPLYIEMKAPEWCELSGKTGQLIQARAPGKPSDEQIEFLTAMHKAGAVCGVAWGVMDLPGIFEAYGLPW